MPTRPLIVRTDDLEFEPCVVRTDFSDEAAWQQVLRRCNDNPDFPTGINPAAIVDDPAFDGATIEEIRAAVAADEGLPVFFVADAVTMRGEQPLLAVQVDDDDDELDDDDDDELDDDEDYDDDAVESSAGQPFRLLPEQVLSVHGNLALANMDFDEFGPGAADPTTYIHRGF
ncbi:MULTISPECIES: DUF6924 domain-containing protein [unclassified Solwaraspora]|uniref:DUF6924 domain-containing protein n=1 Tax=unclassified Solwaraspora TaxID=2627926 RepID=UPI00259BB9DB|nr:hypothetical protein [Solwaraspora sp. WMMA2056]WJK42073.1 hypothetical protein O7608_06680 [Solwaraspora sp. WMMA2056]